MKTLYFECNSGISGDMTVGALLDLGADRAVLERGLASLGVNGYTLSFGRTKKAGIDAFDFDVILDETEAHHHHDHDGHENHGHTHGLDEGEHGHTHEHTHEEENHDHNDHHHAEEHAHVHDEEHTHAHPHTHAHAHEHRNLHDILHLIGHGDLTPRARELAVKIFTIVAEAEAKAHGLPVEEVHFHEVGAVDSIVDVVGAAICIDNLNPDRILCSPLTEGSGTVKCAHGLMSVPVPAVVNIAAAGGVPLKPTAVSGELVTPTGIAIVSAAAESFGIPSQLNILKTGLGAGNKDIPDRANVLRVYWLEDGTEKSADEVTLMETNIDDQTAEQLGFAAELLLEQGALDCWFEPIQMKKGRPAVKLCVLCKPEQEDELARTVFLHTSSIGIRKSNFTRTIMQRTFETVSTKYGEIAVKVCHWGNVTKHTVEFEHAKQAALCHHVTIEQVMRETLSKFCQ